MDLVAVVATLALGLAAIADVLYLNIRERANEFAVLRSSGWPVAALARLVIFEGATLGLIGSVPGAALGIAGSAFFAQQIPPSLGRENALPSELSGGQQQRVAIARALVGRPRLLLADEPTGNLDSRTGETILDLLIQLRTTQGAPTMLLATHELRLANACDRIIRLTDGRIVEDITTRVG